MSQRSLKEELVQMFPLWLLCLLVAQLDPPFLHPGSIHLGLLERFVWLRENFNLVESLHAPARALVPPTRQ